MLLTLLIMPFKNMAILAIMLRVYDINLLYRISFTSHGPKKYWLQKASLAGLSETLQLRALPNVQYAAAVTFEQDCSFSLIFIFIFHLLLSLFIGILVYMDVFKKRIAGNRFCEFTDFSIIEYIKGSRRHLERSAASTKHPYLGQNLLH